MTDAGTGTVQRWVLPLLGLALAFGLPALPLGHWLSPGDGLGARIGREAIWWGIGTLILAWVFFAERRPLSSIGLKPPNWLSLAWAIGGAILLMASVMLSYAVIVSIRRRSSIRRASDLRG